MQERILNKVWGYWFITDALLISWAFGWADGLILAILLSTIQVGHFYYEDKSIAGFPTQVRIAYLLLLILALWSPLAWLIYVVILGTTAMVVFDYCFLARFMSLMPWNYPLAYQFQDIWNTFMSKPIAGSVLKKAEV
jgi:hypothetical protein